MIEPKKLVIADAQLSNLEMSGTNGLQFTGKVKWSTTESLPEDFDNLPNELNAETVGSNETIDLSAFKSFPSVDTSTLYLLEKVILNTQNTGEKLNVVSSEKLLYHNTLEGEVMVLHDPLFVTPTGPRLLIEKRITEVNGYPVEDTLMFEPDHEVVVKTLFEITNTGNDISSNTLVRVKAGNFYEAIADSLKGGNTISDGEVHLSLGSLVPGETKKTNVYYLLKNLKDKTELMRLVKSTGIVYEGTSIEALYNISDTSALTLGLKDFQLHAATSVINGNQVHIEVTAVNRGLPAKNVTLRIFPVVGQGIA
ncbi:MAG: hypothetical protein HC906_12625 [Bacteroidales bacterium]|nr:hypothetical protein [Bacteroidales bacterium]